MSKDKGSVIHPEFVLKLASLAATFSDEELELIIEILSSELKSRIGAESEVK